MKKILFIIFIIFIPLINAATYEQVQFNETFQVIKTTNLTFINSNCGNFTFENTTIQTISCNTTALMEINQSRAYCNVNMQPPNIQNNISLSCPAIPACPQPIVNVPDSSERCLNASLESTSRITDTIKGSDDKNTQNLVNVIWILSIILIIGIIAFSLLLYHDRKRHHSKEVIKDGDGISETAGIDKPKPDAGKPQTSFDKYAPRQ